MSITLNCMNDIMKFYELYIGSGIPKYPELWSCNDFMPQANMVNLNHLSHI